MEGRKQLLSVCPIWLFKMDISLRWTLSAGPKGVRFIVVAECYNSSFSFLFTQWYLVLFFFVPQNINRPSESSTRAPVHTPLLSPPSKDSHDKVPNGGFSRNRGPSYSAHPAESEVRDPGVATAYSSLYTANDPLGRRPPIRLYGNTLSTIPSASSFEDSLEIGESSSRVRRNEACSTSSLGLRPTIANNSGIVFLASVG